MRKRRRKRTTAGKRIPRSARSSRKKKGWAPGISVITCTHSPDFMDNIFRNYRSQSWRNKELILILNHDQLDLSQWRERAAFYPNVRVYQLPQATTLGACLNYGVKRARYSYVAKFDHDDYYGSRYLTGMIGVFRNKSVDVAGKRSYYTYIEDRNLCIIRFPRREQRFVSRVHGATFVVRKKVLKRIPFADVPIDDDGIFLRSCQAKGVRIYSAHRADYVYIRRQGQAGHGWQVDHSYLLERAKVVGHPEHLGDILNLVTKGRTAGLDSAALERELHVTVNRSDETRMNQITATEAPKAPVTSGDLHAGGAEPQGTVPIEGSSSEQPIAESQENTAVDGNPA